MNTMISKIVSLGGALILTLISGVVLNRLGKPYNTGIFTIHKLTAMGTIILLAVMIRNLSRTTDVQILSWIIFAVTGLMFLALIVSGALLSLDIAMPLVASVHRVAPVLALIASAVSLYLLVGSQALTRIGMVQ